MKTERAANAENVRLRYAKTMRADPPNFSALRLAPSGIASPPIARSFNGGRAFAVSSAFSACVVLCDSCRVSRIGMDRLPRSSATSATRCSGCHALHSGHSPFATREKNSMPKKRGSRVCSGVTLPLTISTAYRAGWHTVQDVALTAKSMNSGATASIDPTGPRAPTFCSYTISTRAWLRGGSGILTALPVPP